MYWSIYVICLLFAIIIYQNSRRLNFWFKNLINMEGKQIERKTTINNESEFKEFRRIYKLPEIHTIFQSKRNPFETDPRVAQWFRQVFGFSQLDEKKYREYEGLIQFASYFYPFCDDIDRFERLVKYVLLLFFSDDHSECKWGDGKKNTVKIKQIWEQVISVIDKIENPINSTLMCGWKPYTLYWYAIMNDICLESNPISKKRRLKEMRVYCEGNIIESELIDKSDGLDNFANMEDFLKMRRLSAAIFNVAGLIEYSENICLSEEEWNDQLFQDLLQLGSDVITCNNDVVSFEHEWNEQSQQMERMFNLVAFTAIKEDIPIEEALKKVAVFSMQLERDTMELINKIENKSPSKNMKIFLDRFGYLLGGNFQAGMKSDRYNKIYE